jgi:long-chain acyl-CoA synthetase
MVETGDTFPSLLLKHARVRPDRPAIREKDFGIWQTWTWREFVQGASEIAAGLHSRGFKAGMRLALVGENRPRIYWAMSAAQMLGGIPVPMYQDAIATEMAFVLDDAEIEFAVVEDQEQVDKLLEARAGNAKLKNIYFDDDRGLRGYDEEGLTSLDSLQQVGKALLAQDAQLVERIAATVKEHDVAAMFYTSGTTGNPKGVVLSHLNLISSAKAGIELDGLNDKDEVLAYLPVAWIGQNIFSYAQAMVAGFCVNCPESADTTAICMREIGPTYYFAPPRVLEAMLTEVMIRMEDAAKSKRRMFDYFMNLAKKVGARIMEGDKTVSAGDRVMYALGDFMVYGPLRNSLGMSRIRVAYTAGEAIGPDLFTFYRSIGVNLKQLYGSTETSVFACVQPNGEVRADTVGPPVKGVEIRLSDVGEIFIKSPGIFQHYHNAPQATADAKDADGWYRTGDAGYFDTNGHLKIIDRAKDVGKLANGTMFAPKYLENKVKFSPYVKEAVAFGADKDFVVMMLNIDITAVGDWAERRNLPYSGYVDLAGKPEVRTLLADVIRRVNIDLANDPKLSGSQIHRFIVLHKELDADDGELTRTRKVRRGFIGDRYAVLVDALYTGKKQVHIESIVKFEDGRTGKVAADIVVEDAVLAPGSSSAQLKIAA